MNKILNTCEIYSAITELWPLSLNSIGEAVTNVSLLQVFEAKMLL